MLRYAFDTLGALRVEWHTDGATSGHSERSSGSAPSVRACCGATASARTGAQRDTVLYSMITTSGRVRTHRLAAALGREGT
ncbi:hypothetical protein GCM10020218_005550 [Dactylosporangium vinaceum]